MSQYEIEQIAERLAFADAKRGIQRDALDLTTIAAACTEEFNGWHGPLFLKQYRHSYTIAMLGETIIAVMKLT